MKKQDMNLLTTYQKVSKLRANRDAVGRIYIMIFFGSVLIAGAVYFVLFLQNEGIKQRIADVERYLSSPQVVERSNEANRLNADIRKLEDILAEVQSAQNIFELQPILSSSVMNILLAERPGTVRIIGMEFTGDTILLNVSGTRVYSVSDYVMRLKRLNVFLDVIYTGYDLTDGVFNSNIVVVLKGGR